MTPLRTLTTSAVAEAAHLLMHRHGTTTTLDVKQHLRRQGFWAVQAEVSSCMAHLAAACGWRCLDTGRFRVYSLSLRRHALPAAALRWFDLN